MVTVIHFQSHPLNIYVAGISTFGEAFSFIPPQYVPSPMSVSFSFKASFMRCVYIRRVMSVNIIRQRFTCLLMYPEDNAYITILDSLIMGKRFKIKC